ncbi:MAG: hypothetical protein GXY76_08815 [Chloroflexi bacterium]|nr:hypothetical protein [Chloroflexota bacterium]
MSEQLADNEIILFGQVHALRPLKGRKAREMMPRVVAFSANAITALVLGDWDIMGLADRLARPENALSAVADLGQLVQFLMVTLQGKWEEFDRDLLPFLLQVEPAALEEEGDVVEVYLALYRAVRWYATKSITSEQRAAFLAAMDNMRKNAKPRGSKA